MHYFLLAVLLFPFLLHSYVIVHRKSRHDLALSVADCSPAITEGPTTNGPTVVVEVDNRTQQPSSFSPILTWFDTGNPLPQQKESTVLLQPDFSTTNVLLEPLRKRSGADALDGVGAYCAEADD
jgi:hypothetical protein